MAFFQIKLRVTVFFKNKLSAIFFSFAVIKKRMLENYDKSRKNSLNLATVFKQILIETKIYSLFDGVAIEIIRFFFSSYLGVIKAKAIGHVTGTIVVHP